MKDTKDMNTETQFYFVLNSNPNSEMGIYIQVCNFNYVHKMHAIQENKYNTHIQ